MKLLLSLHPPISNVGLVPVLGNLRSTLNLNAENLAREGKQFFKGRKIMAYIQIPVA